MGLELPETPRSPQGARASDVRGEPPFPVILTLAVALSIALFHATEYLAIVSWAVLRKPAQSRRGAFAYLAPRWVMSLVIFMGVLAISAWAISGHFTREWIVLTIAVSFLHYAYDGMIWKAPSASTTANNGCKRPSAIRQFLATPRWAGVLS